MANKYARLFDPVNQFVRKDGIPNAGGSLNIFYEGTDDRAELRDEDGTVLSNPLSLDADGRALGTFVDSSRVYRLEVRDAYGAEQFTVRKMVPCGGGTGSTLGKEYNVVSGDGTVKVTSYVDAGVITFDLSTSYELEGARWGAKLSLLDHIAEADEWQELHAVSAQGSIPYVSGWYPGHAGAFDLAGSVEMVQGVPTAIHTVEVMAALVVGGVQKEVQYGIIDPSLPEQRVSFEFKGETEGEETVDVLYYVRSSETMSIGLAARTWYNDEVDGVVGGGGGGSVGYSAGEGIHIDSANVISVTGMIPESASSQFAPSGDYAYNSSLTAYQPTGDYAYNSSLSSKLDASASSQFAPSGDYAYNSSLTGYQPTGDYAYNSSLSSKLDASASSQFQPSGNYQSALTFGYSGDAISSIDGSAIAGMGGHEYTGIYPVIVDNTADSISVDSTGLSIDETMSAYASGDDVVIGVRAGQFAPTGDYAYNSAVSAIASSYAESAASGKQDTLEFGYDANNLISSIDGSALAGQGGGGGATGDYVETSATNVAIGSSVDARNDDTFAQGRYCSSNSRGLAQGYSNRASSYSFAQGSYNNANVYSFAQGSYNSADSDGFAQGYKNTGRNLSFAQGERNSADMYSFAQGNYSTAYGVSFAQGSGVSAKNTASVFGTNNHSGDGTGTTGAAFVIGDGTASNARHDLMVVTKDGEITMFSGTADTVGTGIMSSIRAISAAATGGGGGVDSATVSAIASAYVESGVSSKLDSSASSSFYTTANESGFITGVDLTDYATTAYVDSAVSGKMDSSASSSFYTTANESGFVDSAYVDYAVSGKMDASAIDYTRTGGGTQIYASGTGSSTNQFSAKNNSAGAAIIAGENARLRLWDTAATANLYASSIGGWNAASNLVSSQSANWGGSALQLSAGPGVTFTKSGNVLVAGLDETVLWSGEGISAGQSTSLSESITAFERIRVYGHTHSGKAFSWTNEQEALSSQIYGVGLSVWQGSNQELDFSRYSVSGSSISALSGSFIANLNPVGMGNSISWVYKVVGINRTAEA